MKGKKMGDVTLEMPESLFALVEQELDEARTINVRKFIRCVRVWAEAERAQRNKFPRDDGPDAFRLATGK